MIKIAPSILAADFAKLGEVVSGIGSNQCDMVHIDVMDGHFVPNITMGPMVVSAMRPYTDCFFDVHLMISDPAKYIPAYIEAGADGITFHYEAIRDQILAEYAQQGQELSAQALQSRVDERMQKIVDQIHQLGKKAAVSINPNTELHCVENILDRVDMLLVMTVFPGFGGQKFMPETMSKVQEARRRFPQLDIQLDGGISPANMEMVTECGATVLVMGTAYFKSEDPAALVEKVHNL